MGNDWIIHVLADLQTFAKGNDLPLLAVQLEQTALVATAEITTTTRDTPRAVCGDTVESRSLFAQTGPGHSA